MKLPKGIHRVRRKLASGKSRFHFYYGRGKGSPKFWEDDHRNPTDPDFLIAYAEIAKRPKPSVLTCPALVELFFDSAAMPKGDRSKQDIKKWLLRWAAHFHDAPAVIWEERGSRGEMNKWRTKWKHSPKQHDMAGTHAVRLLNWAVEEGHISEHHCDKLRRLYEVDRSEIVWTRADRDAFNAKAPEWVRRILTVACETGLRPGDLIKLNRGQIEETARGRRLRIRKTNKRGRSAHIPIDGELAAVIDQTPRDRFLILANASGGPLTEHRASEGVRQWRDKAGLSSELRLQDCRGTAATMLLNAGLSLSEIADYMGWSIRTASQVIEHYARVAPDETDAVLVKLSQVRGDEKRTKL